MTKQESLDALNKEIHADESLPLREGTTQAVPGEGNADADILFIGEAPGKKEDELGRPFVGAAGKFLDELIAGIGYRREDVFIANLIKHRPPDNRDPLPDEIEAYTPWLEKQIAIIEPKVFVTLGRFSMQYFLGDTEPISTMHGQPKRLNDRVIMPMYHPAAALYRGDLRPVLHADFAKILKVIKLVDKEKTAKEEENASQQVLI